MFAVIFFPCATSGLQLAGQTGFVQVRISTWNNNAALASVLTKFYLISLSYSLMSVLIMLQVLYSWKN